MNEEIVRIDCIKHDPNTNMARPFNVAKYTFNYQSNSADRELIDTLITEGAKLANLVNPGAANNGALRRKYERILCNCIAGVLSEYLWKHYLNQEKECVQTTALVDVAAQIDLEIISNNKKVEVRSSFPRNGIPFAVCSSRFQFDILGPYSNGYKPGEIQKDYYIRALFHLQNPTDLLTRIKQDGFEAYLTGGATWQMMKDNTIAIQKNLKPYGDISIAREENETNYRVVPYSRALDTVEIYNLIISEK